MASPTSSPSQLTAGPATSAQVPHLTKYVVPDRDLSCPEYCFKIDVDFTQKLTEDPGVTHLKEILTALLNTSGGILQIRSHDGTQPNDNILDKWKRNLEDALMKFIPRDVLLECIHLVDYNHPLTLYASKSDKFITMTSGMFVRGVAGTTAVNDIDTIRKVISTRTKATVSNPFDGMKEVKYGQTIRANEGPNLEYKCWKCSTISVLKSRLSDERTSKTLFAFPNMRMGGSLVIGVEEDTTSNSNVVKGQLISESQNLELTEFLEQYLKEDSIGNPRFWGDGSRYPELDRDWSITFVPVVELPTRIKNKVRMVIVISFDHFVGGVWREKPVSYQVAADGTVHKYSPNNWQAALHSHNCCNRITQGIGERTSLTSSSVQTETTGVTELPTTSLLRAKPEDRSAQIDTKTAHQVPSDAEQKESKLKWLFNFLQPWKSPANPSHQSKKDDMQILPTKTNASTNHVLRTRDHMSWSKHVFRWAGLINDSSLDKYINVAKLAAQSSIFIMETPIHWTPSRETIMGCQAISTVVMDKALTHIETSVHGQKGFGLCTSQWLKNVENDRAIQRPQDQLFDVLVADESGFLQLWAIVDEKITNYADVWVYLFLSARLIKYTMLQGQNHISGFVNTISIQCKIFQLEHGEVPSRCEDQHLMISKLMMTDGLVAEMKVFLAKALLEKCTRIRSILGDENSILMSAQQMDVILSLGFDKFNHIEGPPGSGKTFMALHLVQKYGNYGYICSTDTFEKFLIHQKLQPDRVFVITSDAELLLHIKQKRFSQFNLLIIDDVHSTTFRDSSWLSLLESIHTSEHTKLVAFGDSQYQNFQGTTKKPTMQNILTEFCMKNNRHWTQKTLTEVHRNTRKVTAFIKANFVDNPDYPDHATISSSNKEQGDDVEVRRFPNIWNDKKENSFVHFVTRLSGPQKVVDNTPMAYEPRDVAILVDTSNALCDAQKLRAILKKNAGNDIRVNSAMQFPVTGYTIDTLDNFMGMDRRVCILVTSESILQAKSSTGRSINNPRYRAFVASRGISRVVFAVEQPLTTSLTGSLNFGDLQIGIKQLWHLEEGEVITDVSYIDIDGTWAVMYTLPNHSSVKVVSMEGEPLPVSVDSLGVRNSVCTASSKDGRRVVLTGYDNLDTGPHRWGLYEVRPGRLRRVARFDVDALVLSVCWTAGSDVILLISKFGHPINVTRVSPTDGRVLWRRDSSVTHLRPGQHLSVNPQTDAILVSNVRCVRELDGQGRHNKDIIPSSDVNPKALCVDSSGQVMFLSDGDADWGNPRWRDIYLMNSVLGQTTKMIQTLGYVYNVRLHGDRYLGVATDNGIVLYDVSALL